MSIQVGLEHVGISDSIRLTTQSDVEQYVNGKHIHLLGSFNPTVAQWRAAITIADAATNLHLNGFKLENAPIYLARWLAANPIQTDDSRGDDMANPNIFGIRQLNQPTGNLDLSISDAEISGFTRKGIILRGAERLRMADILVHDCDVGIDIDGEVTPGVPTWPPTTYTFNDVVLTNCHVSGTWGQDPANLAHQQIKTGPGGIAMPHPGSFLGSSGVGVASIWEPTAYTDFTAGLPSPDIGGGPQRVGSGSDGFLFRGCKNLAVNYCRTSGLMKVGIKATLIRDSVFHGCRFGSIQIQLSNDVIFRDGWISPQIQDTLEVIKNAITYNGLTDGLTVERSVFQGALDAAREAKGANFAPAANAGYPLGTPTNVSFDSCWFSRWPLGAIYFPSGSDPELVLVGSDPVSKMNDFYNDNGFDEQPIIAHHEDGPGDLTDPPDFPLT
jgi:hypothetical protein